MLTYEVVEHGKPLQAKIRETPQPKGSEVLIRKDGDSLVLTPVRRNKLRELLASWEPLDEVLSEAEDLPPQPRDSL
jgi:antitoxin VapB